VSRIVCYLERRAGGAMLHRVRLVGPGLDRTWTAPEEHAGGGSGGDGGGDGASGRPMPSVLPHVQSAATWVRDTLSQDGIKRLSEVCVDTEGASCSWLSAPSASQSVVVAALLQASTTSDASGAGLVGAAAAAPMTQTETSVQALALDSNGSAPQRGLSRFKAGAATGNEPRKRFAVMALPDALVRVFEDELDRVGMSVERVSSLWHLMARTWDPGAPATTRENGAADRLVSENAPSSAVLLIDPDSQRLLWAWSAAGELSAGGSMLLRMAPRPVPAGAGARTDESAGDAIAGIGRGGGPSATAPGGIGGPSRDTMVIGRSELGRLALEWLAWSAQLGQSPRRVVCLGPATAWEETPETPADLRATTLPEALALLWPGASVDFIEHNDPIGASLLHVRERDAGMALPADDPRASLAALSNRPGRADRSGTVWLALAILCASIVIGALGWRLHSGVSAAQASALAAVEKRSEVLKALETDIPFLSKEGKPEEAIRNKLSGMRGAAATLPPPRPVYDEFIRMLTALEGVNDSKMTRLTIGAGISTVILEVPDAATGPMINERLRASKGQITWQLNSPAGGESERRRINFNGTWPEGRPQ
jgi:hypothetical protein